MLEKEEKRRVMYTMCRFYMRTGMPQSNLTKMTQHMNNVHVEHSAGKEFYGLSHLIQTTPRDVALQRNYMEPTASTAI